MFSPRTQFGGFTPGGSDTQVQFNDGGIFGGSSSFVFNKTTGALLMGDGLVGAPSYSFTGDTDTGIYRVGANSLGIAVGGVNIFTASSTGLSSSLAITTTTAPFTLSYTQTTPNTIQTSAFALSYLMTGTGTSTKTTTALFFDVTARSTSTGWVADASYGLRPEGCRGIGGYSRGAPATGGVNVGSLAIAINAVVNIGNLGSSTAPKASAFNIGSAGFAGNTGANGIQIGGLFLLRANVNGSPITGLTSAGILVDNGGYAVPIAEFRNSGAMAARVQPEGAFTQARNSVTTTNATKTTALTVNLTSARYGDGVYSIDFVVLGRSTTDANYAMYRINQMVRELAGVATLVGTAVLINSQETDAAWTPAIEVSGGSVLVTVIGKAATTIVWQADVTQLSKV